MECTRCKVNKPEINFIRKSKLYKQCNLCRDKTNNNYSNKKIGILPKGKVLKEKRELALKKGNFICSKCNLEKPLEEFANNAASLKLSNCSGACKMCIKYAMKFSKIKSQYNLTKEQFLNMFEYQKGKCKICNIDMETFSFDNNKFNTLCIDHCHNTGKVRGFLCNNCNRALGLLKDDPNVLLSAYKYILAHDKSEELLENQEIDNQQPSLELNAL